MAQCEMYKQGKAFQMGTKFLDYSSPKVFVCEIARGKCPYDNEGHRLECPDKTTRTICKTNGGVKETGLIASIEEFTV